MDKFILKELFLTSSQFDSIVKENPLLLDILDENIESILEGKTSIEGLEPKSEEDYVKLMWYGMYCRAMALDLLKSSVPSDHSITLNYRGHSYKIPPRQ